MAHFEVTVRVVDVQEADAVAARRAVEERLRSAGLAKWQIVSVGVPAAVAHTARPAKRPPHSDANYAGGGLLVAAVVAWALWFLWLLAG